jgi:hypothetical protein
MIPVGAAFIGVPRITAENVARFGHLAGAKTSSMLTSLIDPRFSARMGVSIVFRSPTITIARWSG